MDSQLAIRLLQAVGLSAAAQEPMGETEREALADELGVGAEHIRAACRWSDSCGLTVNACADEPAPPHLTAAGKQYLSLRGQVSDSTLAFLPEIVDDLYARRALLVAGSQLTEAFELAIADGCFLEHARQMAPPAFRSAIDERIALRLFSALIALLARLSAEHPAGCLAEEILAVVLIEEAEQWLTEEAPEGSSEHAARELRALFELFEDDDVLGLFTMSEPADAALAGIDPEEHRRGFADQRLEAWFQPFAGVAPTGHLDLDQPT